MNTVDENRVAKKKQSGKIRKKGQIDWMITLLPLGLIAALSILFFLLKGYWLTAFNRQHDLAARVAAGLSNLRRVNPAICKLVLCNRPCGDCVRVRSFD